MHIQDNETQNKLDTTHVLSWVALTASIIAIALTLYQWQANEKFRENITLHMSNAVSSANYATDAATKAEISGQNAAEAAKTSAARAAQASSDYDGARQEKIIASQEAGKAAAAASVARSAAVSAEASAKAVHDLALPDGTKLVVSEGSSVEGIYNLLHNPDSDLSQAVHVGELNFETDSAKLTPDSMAVVEQFVQVLKAFPTATIRIEGHTDSTGDAVHNLELSKARAASVLTALAEHGIAGGRLESEGFGQTHPIASNDNAEGKSLNRRVDVIVLRR
jgi:OmpA-OmpF porin, OOP family